MPYNDTGFSHEKLHEEIQKLEEVKMIMQSQHLNPEDYYHYHKDLENLEDYCIAVIKYDNDPSFIHKVRK